MIFDHFYIIEEPFEVIREIIKIYTNVGQENNDHRFDELLLLIQNWIEAQEINLRIRFILRIRKLFFTKIYLDSFQSIEKLNQTTQIEQQSIYRDKLISKISFYYGYALYYSKIDITPLFEKNITNIKTFVLQYLKAYEALDYLKRLNHTVQQSFQTNTKEFSIDCRNFYYDYKEFFYTPKLTHARKSRSKIMLNYPDNLIVVLSDEYKEKFEVIYNNLNCIPNKVIDCTFYDFWETFKGTSKFNWLASANEFITFINTLNELNYIHIPRKKGKFIIYKVIESGLQFLHKNENFKQLSSQNYSRKKLSEKQEVIKTSKMRQIEKIIRNQK